LYGASTMGGILKYVSRKPNFDGVSGEVQTSLSVATGGGGFNYNVAGVINAPVVADKLALRASAFETHDGGFIDNPVRGKSNVNSSNIYGGRLDLLFKPSDALTVRLNAFAQNISSDGMSTMDFTQTGAPTYGDLQQGNPVDQPFLQQFRLISGTVSYDAGPATLTSVSSYQFARSNVTYDFTRLYVPLLQAFFGRTYSAVGDQQVARLGKFTQELRLASNGTQRVDWLVGGFYTRETSTNEQAFQLRDAAGRSVPNDVFAFHVPSHYAEFAGFADVTVHLTEVLDISGGVRYARNVQDFRQDATGLFGVPNPSGTSADNVATYLANARYKFGDNATAYVRYATGYRPGGPNFVARDAATGRLLARAYLRVRHAQEL